MIEDEIKTGRIVSFAALKAITQAIQGGSGTFGGKKKKEDVATVVVGTHSYPKRPPRPYPQSQAQVYTQAPYIPPHHYYPPQNPLYSIPPPPYPVEKVEGFKPNSRKSFKSTAEESQLFFKSYYLKSHAYGHSQEIIYSIHINFLNLMELAEFRTISELTISGSPDILKNYLSSFIETDTKTVGSSYLIDMPQIDRGVSGLHGLECSSRPDCCSWNGVYCDEMRGRVIELDLSCSRLQDRGVSGLHGSKFSSQPGPGSGRDSIWSDYLYGLRFEPYNFEFLLKNLTQLRVLDLYLVNISPTIPLNFSSYLTTLLLPRSQLRGILPERVFHLSNLESLDLSYSSLTGPIPSNISGLKNLQLLYLSSNYLNGTIPSWIFSLPSLVRLDLSNNSFSGKIQEFKSNTLEAVVLDQNQLQGTIPKSLLDQQELYYLTLSQNNFSGQIASTVCNLKRLIMLDLGRNHLNGTISHCLGEISGLEVLGLNNNHFSGKINATFNTENRLNIINLYGNKLKGKVPQLLINCTYLVFPDLGNNKLNDTFPSLLGGLPGLKILSLRSNKFHGL
ncbi:putative serine/threonine-protein phosphatase PP2A catalytic subunit-like isoform 1 [Capsicum annuum]|nr:putative serine/threonine-protein phosphatase PP2A catalytic subunit-like isoform 1 [Capsicum annuum]